MSESARAAGPSAEGTRAGLVFGTFALEGASLESYIGEENHRLIDRIFHQPIEFLGVR